MASLWKVADTADVGGGFGDLVIQRGYDTRIIEIKSRTGKLTEDQRRFIERDGWHVQIVRSVEDALAL